MSAWRIKLPASRLFTWPFVQAQIKENIKAPLHWPLRGGFTGERWIPHTKGQPRGNCFHLMTSSLDLSSCCTEGCVILLFGMCSLWHHISSICISGTRKVPTVNPIIIFLFGVKWYDSNDVNSSQSHISFYEITAVFVFKLGECRY